MHIPYEFLGKVLIFLLLFALAGTVLALLIGAYSFKKQRIIFPGFVLFTLYLFYSPSKWICRVFRIRDTLVDDILIDVRNAVMCDDFIRVKGRKILLLPQCLRHPNCKARCDPIHGYECKKCGLCDIAKLCDAADRCNFRFLWFRAVALLKRFLKNIIQKPVSELPVTTSFPRICRQPLLSLFRVYFFSKTDASIPRQMLKR